MASPLLLTFVIQLLIKGGSSPVRGKSERFYDACVNQTTITLWPHAALLGLLWLLIHWTAAGQRLRRSVLVQAASQWSRLLAVDYSAQPPKFKPYQRMIYCD